MFGPIRLKNYKSTFFRKQSFKSSLSLYTTVSSCKKIEKLCIYLCLIKHEKPHIELILDPLGVKTPEQDFFPKNLELSLFKLNIP